MKLVVQRVFHRSLAGSAACVVLRQRRMEARHNKLRARLRRAQDLHRLAVQGLPTKTVVVIGTSMTSSPRSRDML